MWPVKHGPVIFTHHLEEYLTTLRVIHKTITSSKRRSQTYIVRASDFALLVTGCLLGLRRLRFFFYNWQGYFSIMVPDFFRLTMFISHKTSSEERMPENGGFDVFLWFLLHVSVWWCIYSPTNGSPSLPLLVLHVYQLCFVLTAFYTIWSFFIYFFQLKLLRTDEWIVDWCDD